MKIHILDDWFDTIRHLPCFEKLTGHDVKIWNDHEEDTDRLAERLREAECLVLFRERTQITRALVERLPNLRLISQRSVYPHIDIEACTDHHILVCSNLHQGSPSFAASEHTFALILAAMRQIPQQMHSLHQGHWQMGVGRTLSGRVIGLYGYGRIGKQVANYARAFGMEVIWWGSEQGRVRAAKDQQSIPATREAFFAGADVISVHVRANESTKGIITANDFKSMRSDALFVNTSRASLIEEGALLQALDNDEISMAAIDVFDQEPITWSNDPLATHPKMLATPHIGFVTEDELETQFSDIFDQISAFVGGNPIHAVNTIA